MPAKSSSQKHFFQMVHAVQMGALGSKDIPAAIKDKVKKAAKSTSEESSEDFAKTKTKGLPKHVAKEEYDFSVLSFKEYLGVHEAFEALSDDEREALIEKCATGDEPAIPVTAARILASAAKRGKKKD